MLLDDEDLKKRIGQLTKEYGYASAGPSPPDMYGIQREGFKEEGWRDLLRNQMDSGMYREDNKLIPKYFPKNKEIAKQLLGHRVVPAPETELGGVNIKEMMNTSGDPWWLDPKFSGERITDPLIQAEERITDGLLGPPSPAQLAAMHEQIGATPGLSSDISSSFPGVGASRTVPGSYSLNMGIHPYSQAMPSAELPGLLDSGEQISQAWPGPDPDPEPDNRIVGQLSETPDMPEWTSQLAGPLAGPLAETDEGGKWETENSIFRRNENRETNPRWRRELGKHMMRLSNNFTQTDPFYF